MSVDNPGSADAKVSVAMLAYNNERFTVQAVESVLMQQTDFTVELVIGEDCSTDGTREIVCGYGERFPGRIRVLLAERNLGYPSNCLRTLKTCGGQYIAYLDTDDYWIDPTKLQKQVDYLDSHPNCAVCAHVTQIVNENGGVIHEALPEIIKAEELTFDDILEEYSFHVSSVMFRNSILQQNPDFFVRFPATDWNLFVFLAQYGNIGLIKQVMSAYRIHSGGLWTSYPSADKWVETVTFYQNWFNYLGPEYHDRIIQLLRRRFRMAGERLASTGFAQGLSMPILKKQGQDWVDRMLAEAHMPSQKARFRRCFLSGFYGTLGFLLYQSDKPKASRSCFLRAASNDLSWVKNMGVWSIVGESVLGKQIASLLRKSLRSHPS